MSMVGNRTARIGPYIPVSSIELVGPPLTKILRRRHIITSGAIVNFTFDGAHALTSRHVSDRCWSLYLPEIFATNHQRAIIFV